MGRTPGTAAAPSSHDALRRRGSAALLFACALLALAGCPSRGDRSASTRPLARMEAPLAWTVNRAQATHHLATASMEGRDAAPGYRFVVLDVSVRNRDENPQVLAEGTLVAMDESKLQTFDRPVNVLSDDYLSLQVLAPAQSLRGKIAYEVPEHLPGVLYWSPGNGSKRILLNVMAPPASQRTLASVDEVDPVAEAGADAERTASIDVPPAKAIEPPPANAPRRSAPKPAPKPDRTVAASTPPAPAKATTAIAATGKDDANRRSAAAPVSVRSTHRDVADIAVPRTTLRLPVTATPPPAVAVATPPPVDPEQARRLACEGLVARDDPAEKARSLDFFARACRDYALPAHWRPQPVARRSLLERASALLARVVVKPHVVRISDCSAATSPADRLVCGDPDLSAMDHRLTQSVARARDHVDDPVALQREQDEWRGRVRNACDTTGCLAQAYGRRIAQLEAIAPMRP